MASPKVVAQEQVDVAFIRRCQQGDELAIEVLVRRYQNYVYRLCYLVLRNEQDAEDMTQETFIRACRALPRFEIREGISFEAWLYRIAVNCCRSRMRRKWYQIVPWQRMGFGEWIAASSEERPERVVLRGEQRSQVLNAINKLGEKHRLVIILRYYAGLSNEEIANVLNIPSGTVRSRLHTARQRLRELLAASGLVDEEDVAEGSLGALASEASPGA
ncbi:MAG: sigma-70 family RNA polymerase sigma factor [Anaerolineae bacterium]|nr:sigma-70 family RNA polymerase sigma factor [Anaerolineae bacterium]